jgi:undecaprenyl-diphosphatase
MSQNSKSLKLYTQLTTLEKIYIVISCLIFITLAILVHHYKRFDLDIAVTCQLQTFTSLKTFMEAVSLLGNNFFVSTSIVVAFASSFYYFGQKLEGRLILLLAGFGQATNSVIKHLVARQRPTPELCIKVLAQETSLSFPSGHVTHYVCLYGFLCFLIYKKVSNPILKLTLMILPACLVLFVGSSRIYLGAHWVTDVTGAYLLSSIWLFLTIKFYNYSKT